MIEILFHAISDLFTLSLAEFSIKPFNGIAITFAVIAAILTVTQWQYIFRCSDTAFSKRYPMISYYATPKSCLVSTYCTTIVPIIQAEFPLRRSEIGAFFKSFLSSMKLISALRWITPMIFTFPYSAFVSMLTLRISIFLFRFLMVSIVIISVIFLEFFGIIGPVFSSAFTFAFAKLFKMGIAPRFHVFFGICTHEDFLCGLVNSSVGSGTQGLPFKRLITPLYAHMHIIPRKAVNLCRI